MPQCPHTVNPSDSVLTNAALPAANNQHLLPSLTLKYNIQTLAPSPFLTRTPFNWRLTTRKCFGCLDLMTFTWILQYYPWVQTIVLPSTNATLRPRYENAPAHQKQKFLGQGFPKLRHQMGLTHRRNQMHNQATLWVIKRKPVVAASCKLLLCQFVTLGNSNVSHNKLNSLRCFVRTTPANLHKQKISQSRVKAKSKVFLYGAAWLQSQSTVVHIPKK